MVTKTYRKNRRIIGYITKNERSGTFAFCTGKPSDNSCISWSGLPNQEIAEEKADDYFANAAFPL